MEKLIIAIATAAVAGSGMWEFLKWAISRLFGRKSGEAAIMAAVQALKTDIDSLREEMGEDRAINARVRILSFCDELQEGRRHSKDSFDQVMSDITTYNKYCSGHPSFKNSQTVATVDYIKKVYAERLEKHDFL